MSFNLFCYGTLCESLIMRRVIGRVPLADIACLEGYKRYAVRGENYPAVLADKSAFTQGILYRGVQMKELIRLDRYEGPEYRRELRSVVNERSRLVSAWVYVYLPRYRYRLA